MLIEKNNHNLSSLCIYRYQTNFVILRKFAAAIYRGKVMTGTKI